MTPARTLIHLTSGTQLVVDITPAEMRERMAGVAAMAAERGLTLGELTEGIAFVLIGEDSIRIDQIAAIVPERPLTLTPAQVEVRERLAAGIADAESDEGPGRL